MLTGSQCNTQCRLAIGSTGGNIGTEKQQLPDTDFTTEMRRKMQGTKTAGIPLIWIHATLQQCVGQTPPAKMDRLQQRSIVLVLVTEYIDTAFKQ